jgi:enamine deaminase RidA (YjgF/YER057c/UK114 family)
MKATYFLLSFLILFSYGCTEEQNINEEKHQISEEVPTIDYDKKLADLEIELPSAPDPVANYVNYNISSGNILFLSGKGPNLPEGGYITGKVGSDLSVEEGYEAARITAIMQIAVLKNALGDLNRVKQILKVTGMVNATEDFGQQPEVINGFSDLMVEVFGDRGKHARSAVGMGSLPRNIAVEIEAIVEVFPEN